jgi:uncharacterized protein (DUF427 family)
MMSSFPPALTAVNFVAPVPRRIRGFKNGEVLVDTANALYVWEWPHYPHYYFPKADVKMDAFAEGREIATPQGAGRHLGFKGADAHHRPAARLIATSDLPGLENTVRIEWSAADRWFEEDEEVFVHPRSPYKRIDALRSNRAVRVELNGVVLADAKNCVMLFETGLPTRYYLDPANVRFAALTQSPTVTQCPYKGKTGGYWSARAGETKIADVAWRYEFTTPAMTAIAGLIAFLNEKVDIFVEGTLQARPETHFS